MYKIFKKSLLLIFAGGILHACQNKQETLPILGEKTPVTKTVDGKEFIDTTYHTIPAFSFIDQDSVTITGKSLDNQVYIADFFFTSCPSICPIMKKQMLRVYDEYKGNKEVAFLSHSIDPKHDTIPVLKDYATKLGVDAKQWHFLYGNKDSVFKIAEKSYMSSVFDDKKAPGGYVHSGYFLLVDKQKRIRGAYDGTNEEQVTKLIKDIPVLLAEYQK